ncbi:hypothetical protein [Proteiniclasticum sp. QWL-01]|uniref:hypothetical protein n=1 Tax=Proteiniclasticum sp. QWL-01 TaxID=3036945 RepID=UPI0024117968|nr:hypothetical protein [Proteiniclasticum sp. QWL-01]WFF74447.1 hypothetical protein P6M73_08350 [Proteiniclasticum sp. QWL-01]
MFGKTCAKPSTAFSAVLEALADLSMINPPSHPVLAIDRKALKIGQLEPITNQDLMKDEELVELELWDYNPGIFTYKPQVDLLSFYASLRENTDERVEQALEEILRGEPWYYELKYKISFIRAIRPHGTQSSQGQTLVKNNEKDQSKNSEGCGYTLELMEC